jgi:hypothetical protein
MAIKEAFEGQDDYTWDDFGLVDRSWDEWFADKWEPGGVFQIKSNQTTNGKFGIHASIASSFTADFRPGFIFQSGIVNMPLAFSIATSGAGGVTRPIISTLQGVFTQTSSAQVIFKGNIDLTGAFSPFINAQINVQAIQALMALQSSLSIIPSRARLLQPNEFASIFTLTELDIADPFHSFKPLQETRILKAITDLRTITPLPESRLLKLSQESNVKQVDSESRNINVKTESRQYTVNSETKNIKVPSETRIYIVNSTNRLNSIVQETKVIKVTAENRILKIKRPALIDVESVPRVRGD